MADDRCAVAAVERRNDAICDANHPADISDRGWFDVLARLARSLGRDSMWLRSAGVAFCGVFAAIPAASVLMALVGLLASPEAVHQPVEMLGGLVPARASDFLADQMQAIALASRTQLGAGLGGAALAALWGTWSGASGLIAALNVAYREEEVRTVLRRAWDALVVALAAGLLMLLAFALMALIPLTIGYLPLGPAAKAVSFARWPALAVLCIVTLAMLYRFAPCRQVALGEPGRDRRDGLVAHQYDRVLVLCFACPLVQPDAGPSWDDHDAADLVVPDSFRGAAGGRAERGAGTADGA